MTALSTLAEDKLPISNYSDKLFGPFDPPYFVPTGYVHSDVYSLVVTVVEPDSKGTLTMQVNVTPQTETVEEAVRKAFDGMQGGYAYATQIVEIG